MRRLYDIRDIEEFLAKVGVYGDMLRRYLEEPENRSIWFEMVFAYMLEAKGITPEREKGVNTEVKKTVDFAAAVNGIDFYMELVRVEHSDEIRRYLEAKKESGDVPAFYGGLLLTSDDKNDFFQTAAQLIRLQEKILEKVEKFGEPSPDAVSIIVVDCSNINLGMLDSEDVRMAVYGKARNAFYQEYFKGKKLMGLFEDGFKARQAEELCRKVSAIVFLKELSPEALDEMLVAINPRFDVLRLIRQFPVFQDIENVQPD